MLRENVKVTTALIETIGELEQGVCLGDPSAVDPCPERRLVQPGVSRELCPCQPTFVQYPLGGHGSCLPFVKVAQGAILCT